MKVAVFIDGGYLRVLVRQASFAYTPEYIEQIEPMPVSNKMKNPCSAYSTMTACPIPVP